MRRIFLVIMCFHVFASLFELLETNIVHLLDSSVLYLRIHISTKYIIFDVVIAIAIHVHITHHSWWSYSLLRHTTNLLHHRLNVWNTLHLLSHHTSHWHLLHLLLHRLHLLHLLHHWLNVLHHWRCKHISSTSSSTIILLIVGIIILFLFLFLYIIIRFTSVPHFLQI